MLGRCRRRSHYLLNSAGAAVAKLSPLMAQVNPYICGLLAGQMVLGRREQNFAAPMRLGRHLLDSILEGYLLPWCGLTSQLVGRCHRLGSNRH